MEISKIGEFGLIDRLTKDLKNTNDSTRYGVGDDCAVLSYPNSEVLVTTDMLMEGVHFDLTYIDLKHLGYKSAMVNISAADYRQRSPRQTFHSRGYGRVFQRCTSGVLEVWRRYRWWRYHILLYRSCH